MKNTVDIAVTDRTVSTTKDVVDWINKEAIPFMKQVRGALNQQYCASFGPLTTAHTGAFTTIWTSDPLPTNSSWQVGANVVGFTTSGSANRCAYIRTATFYNSSGTVAQQGATQSDYTEESDAGCDVRLRAVGQTVQLDVKDNSTDTFNWVALVKVVSSREV